MLGLSDENSRARQIISFTMVRVKRRYILAELKMLSGKHPTSYQFCQEFKAKFEELYGDYGAACLDRGFHIKRYNNNDGSIIISIRRGVHEMALSTIPLIASINSNPCKVTIVHLSGTIRKSLSVLKVNSLRNLRKAIGKQLERENAMKRLRETPAQEPT